jgi:hypothetical protein
MYLQVDNSLAEEHIAPIFRAEGNIGIYLQVHMALLHRMLT